MATVFCFTSTGNSLYVSKKIAEDIGANVVSMTKSVTTCEDDVIGFVFPVYFWGLPKIVERFISNIKITNESAYIFAVVTYGNVISGVTGAVKNILKQKGLTLSYGGAIKSVENYIPGYKVNDSEELQKSADQNLKIISGEIAARRHNKIGSFTVLNKFIYSLFPGKHSGCDKFFTVSEKCTGCGICQNICPADNITLESGKPDFHHNCEHCLACIHACPANSIEWKKSTINKQRYRNPHISLNEMQSFNSTGDETNADKGTE